MCAIIAIYNQKGGVGKSTTAIMLADGLAYYHGYRVLVIDFDFQASSSRILIGSKALVEAHSARRSLQYFLTGLPDTATKIDAYIKKNASDIKEINGEITNPSLNSTGSIDIIPSARMSSEHSATILSCVRNIGPKVGVDETLKIHFERALKEISCRYDCIILDCPSGQNDYSSAAIMLSHCMLVPTDLGEDSFAVLTGLLSDVRLRWKKDLRTFVRVLVCRYDSHSERQNMHLHRLKADFYRYPLMEGTVKNNDAIKRAMEHNGSRMWTKKYNSHSAQSVKMVAGAVIGAFGQWMNKRIPSTIS